MALEHYIGKTVITKVAIPSDERFHMIPPRTTLVVSAAVGEQHLHLDWPDGERAANQVHYSKLMTG